MTEEIGTNGEQFYTDASSDEYDDELDLNEEIPVTGFAVASNKRNADFHEMFPQVPEGDYLIEGKYVWVILILKSYMIFFT